MVRDWVELKDVNGATYSMIDWGGILFRALMWLENEPLQPHINDMPR